MYLLNSADNFKNLYKIVVATPYDQETFKEKSPLSLSIDKLGLESQTYVFYNNKEGLPKLYNSFIKEEYRDNKIIFVHHDVLIEDLFLEEKLHMAFEKYDIVGLAGSKKCDLNSPMAAWHLMCKQEDMVGEVSHSKDKKSWTTIFGPSDSRALILDGLFIAADISRLLDTQTTFDENFEFHHYDISFCLRANKNKLKMGVYPIKVTHFGLGDSMLSSSWQESANKFKKLYYA
jgi:hypothetical protein